MKILILEDEFILQMLYKKTIQLKFRDKVEIHQATTVAQARSLCNEHKDFDLFLLDFHLPDGTSLDFLQCNTCSTPSIVISSHDLSDLTEWFKDRPNVREIISKPLDIRSFSEIIEDYLDPKGINSCVGGPNLFFKEPSYAF